MMTCSDHLEERRYTRHILAFYVVFYPQPKGIMRFIRFRMAILLLKFCFVGKNKYFLEHSSGKCLKMYSKFPGTFIMMYVVTGYASYFNLFQQIHFAFIKNKLFHINCTVSSSVV